MRTRRVNPAFGVRVRGERPPVPCPECGRTMEDARLYELRGRAGELLLTLRSVPCHVCPDDRHPRVASSNDFRSKVLESLLRGTFPASRVRRLGRRVCFECGKRFREGPAVEGGIEDTVRVDGAAMTVSMVAPVIECPRCGRRQVQMTKPVAERVGAALDGALAKGRFAR
ncbi:MAG: hypothetical protein R3195_16285 [Gemmatimonadota bacterium]|nr:hypothetical protein [Gemmatimonadota bacterium]